VILSVAALEKQSRGGFLGGKWKRLGILSVACTLSRRGFIEMTIAARREEDVWSGK